MRSYNQKTGGLESGPREQPAGGRCGGFTLIELLSALAIIAVLIGLLLPAIQKAREEYAKNMAADNLRALLTASNDYLGGTGSYPSELSDLARFCAANPASCQFDRGLLRGRAGGHNIILANTEGDFHIMAEPEYPGITGSQTLTIDQGGVITEAPTPGSDEARQQAFDNILASGARAAVDLLEMDQDASSQVREYTESSATLMQVFNRLDTNSDGEVSIAEIADADFPPVETVSLNLMWNSLTQNDRQAIAVGMGELDTTGPLLFSYDALGRLTIILNGGDGNDTIALIEKLEAAEAAEASGDRRGKARALKQYRDLVKDAVGESLTRANAKVLIALSKTL